MGRGTIGCVSVCVCGGSVTLCARHSEPPWHRSTTAKPWREGGKERRGAATTSLADVEMEGSLSSSTRPSVWLWTETETGEERRAEEMTGEERRNSLLCCGGRGRPQSAQLYRCRCVEGSDWPGCFHTFLSLPLPHIVADSSHAPFISPWEAGQ